MSTIGDLVGRNVALLRQGCALLSTVAPRIYANNGGAFFTSGAGMHFRQVLDFYSRFFATYRNRLDYDTRERDTRTQAQPPAALERAGDTIRALEKLDKDESSDRAVRIGGSSSISTTVGRELQYLMDHTIHHYAIIGMILMSQGVEVDREFGVAPSTLAYWKRTGG